MQSLCGRLIRRQNLNGSKIAYFRDFLSSSNGNSVLGLSSLRSDSSSVPNGTSALTNRIVRMFHQLTSRSPVPLWAAAGSSFSSRSMTTMGNSVDSTSQSSLGSVIDAPPRIKFKRLNKTAKHIMQILDKEAVEEVRAKKEIPDIRPGYIVQLKVEVPENKRRVSVLKGTVIARRNAGLNTTFRLRRQVAGVGVECLFPLYSPNIKEIKVLDKKKVRRAKLYYLRDRVNALRK